MVFKKNYPKELPDVLYVDVQISSNHEVHWTLNNEDPLLLEFSKSLGNIYYFSSLLDFKWTDLPIRAIVVPLYRLLILTELMELTLPSSC